MMKGIFFDVGGVLLIRDIEAFYMALSKELGVDYERFMRLHSKHKKSLLLGKLTAREFSDKARRCFKTEMEYQKLWKTIYLRVTPPNMAVFRIAKKLRGKYVLGIISNSMEDCDAINSERGIYDGFKPVILSSRCGFAKPDKRIFEIALRESGLKAEECIFIDDRVKLLETPRKMGFVTILYKNHTRLLRDLKEEGIDP